MKFSIASKRPQFSTRYIQPLLLFLLGVGFVALGFRTYPAFIAVGSLFLIIGYRGYTHRRADTSHPD